MSESDPPGRGTRGVAATLEWNGDGSPRVTAAGRGTLADAILDAAAEHDVHLHEDAGLAEALSELPLDDEIPDALFRAVAEVLVFAYWATGRLDATGEVRARPAGGRRPASGE